MALEVKQLEVTQGALANEGYHPIGFGIEYWKEHQSSFSDAHHVLMDFLWCPGKYDYTNSLQMRNDPDASTHPEVYQAWRAAGGDENIQMVAKVPELGKWGVGFGGKKNAERAAKLALAISIAVDSERTPQVIQNYPSFGKLLSGLGMMGGSPGMGGGFRAAPY